MSYINTYYNSVTRMTGLSGLDVDSLVYQLMQVERLKVDSVSKSRQLLLWKQEQYREITSALQSFSNEYFNALKPATDMRNSSIYNAFTVKYNGLDTNPYFTASAGSGAKAGDYTIKNIVTAKAARVNGSVAAGSLLGSALTSDKISRISSTAGNNVFAVEFNGVKRNIVLSGGFTNIDDLKADLQNKLDEAFGSGKITVEAAGNRLSLETSSTNTLKVSNTMNEGYKAIFNSDLGSGITLTGQNNKFRIALGSEQKEFELTPGEVYADADALAQVIQTLVDDAEFGFGEDKITVKVENNKIVLESTDPNVSVSASAAENRGLEAIGLDGPHRSNKLDLDANIYDIRDSFAIPLTIDEQNTEISFVINDQTFSFDSRTTSMNKIMSTVNSNAAAGVRMSYDSLNGKFVLESRETGVTTRINAADSSGGLLASLSLTAENVTGSDASITYDDGINGEQVITRSTNSFNINGIVFNLKKDFEGAAELSVTSDPTKAVELIKGFVEKYNELLDKINTKLAEKREYAYEPLTDEQKDAMTEDEIKRWEEKAKSGLLGGDSLLRAIVTELRNAVISNVEGAGLTLADIGIKSYSWVDEGKGEVDEEKLKKALAENPTGVFELFTRQSDVSYNSAVGNASARNERFRESGLIYRFYDVIQDNIRTITIGGQRGALLEKAGMTGDRSLFNNTLYHQISDYDRKIDKLNDELIMKENQYYIQFAQLERLISEMNNQSMWLAQQFMR